MGIFTDAPGAVPAQKGAVWAQKVSAEAQKITAAATIFTTPAHKITVFKRIQSIAKPTDPLRPDP
jgi:hypothetical protein